jgi:hypothetical protein
LDIDEAVRGDDQIEEADDGSGEDGDRDEPDTLARKPGPASQEVARPVHYGSLLGWLAYIRPAEP